MLTSIHPIDTPLAQTPRATALRVGLVAGCVLALALAAALGQAGTAPAAEPELARLLRGITLIKAAAVLAAIGVLWWRFGLPASNRVAAVYLVGVWLAAAGSLLIWQLNHIALAALGFHVGEIAVLIVAWRDGQSLRKPRR